MKRAKKLLLSVVALGALVGIAAMVMASNRQPENGAAPTVEVTRGNIVDKALAVGTIEPRVEISVKSQVSGVVKRQFAEVGDFVKAGTPLLEIQPNPTPRELIEAERQIELRELDLKNLQAEYDRQRRLRERGLISAQEFERSEQAFQQARLQVQMARESLALIREGKVTTDRGSFETVVRAPVSGYILDKMIEIGDPVVPLTSYQEGTVLMTMADMNDLVFRGTVDEIDVGRLVETMPVDIKIGALTSAEVHGTLSKIWLKARKEENSTTFPVEIEIRQALQRDPAHPEAAPRAAVLRAGYSANAEIIIERRDNVLLIPERVIDFKGDTARVVVVLPDGREEQRVVQTGLSDALNIEVISGLSQGARVREKEQKEIE